MKPYPYKNEIKYLTQWLDSHQAIYTIINPSESDLEDGDTPLFILNERITLEPYRSKTKKDLGIILSATKPYTDTAFDLSCVELEHYTHFETFYNFKTRTLTVLEGKRTKCRMTKLFNSWFKALSKRLENHIIFEDSGRFMVWSGDNENNGEHEFELEDEHILYIHKAHRETEFRFELADPTLPENMVDFFFSIITTL